MAPVPPPAVILTPGRVAAARRALERAAREAVPALADFCLLHVRLRGTLTPVAGAHATTAGDRDLRALMRAHRIALDDHHSTAARVVRTGQPVLRSGIHQPAAGSRGTSRIESLVTRLAPRSALVVPVTAGTGVLGALSLCYSLSGRRYAARDLTAARRLAARMAGAIVPEASPDTGRRLRPLPRHGRQGTIARRRLAARE